MAADLKHALVEAGDAVWQGVWQHLDRTSKQHVRLCSKHLQRWVDNHLASLCIPGDVGRLPTLQRFGALQTLRLPAYAFMVAGKPTQHFKHRLGAQHGPVTSLRGLELHSYQPLDMDVADMAHCVALFPNLRQLSCPQQAGSAAYTVAALHQLASLQQMRDLSIGRVEAGAWTALSSLSALVRLQCASADTSVLCLAQLTELDVSRYDRPLWCTTVAVSSTVPLTLAALTRLVVLKLPSFTVDDIILVQLTAVTSLREVEVADIKAYGGSNHDDMRDSCNSVGTNNAASAQLTWTKLYLVSATSKRLRFLRSLPCLQSLNVCLSYQEDWKEQQLEDFVKDAAHIPHVMFPVDYRGLDTFSMLAQLPGLRVLQVDMMIEYGDESIETVSLLTQLTQLQLSLISPQMHVSFLRLCHLRNLRKLYLSFNLTADVLDELYDNVQPPVAVLSTLLLASPHLAVLGFDVAEDSNDILEGCAVRVQELLREAGSDWVWHYDIEEWWRGGQTMVKQAGSPGLD